MYLPLINPISATTSGYDIVDVQPEVGNTEHERMTSLLLGVYDLMSYGRWEGGGGHGCMAIAIHFPILFAENVNFSIKNCHTLN